MKQMLQQTLVFGLIAVLLLGTSGSAPANLINSDNIKIEAGELSTIPNENVIFIERLADTRFRVDIGEGTLIEKNGAKARIESLEIGDQVKVRYLTGILGAKVFVSIRAKSPVFSGRLSIIDVDRRLVTIKGSESERTFLVRSQTVVLKDGSLTKLYDLEAGLPVEAEYTNADNPKLIMLKVGGSGVATH